MTNEFLNAVHENGEWELIRRTDGKVASTIKAKDHGQNVYALACADPACNMTAPSMNGTPVQKVGASMRQTHVPNMFLDDTACNLASINLMQFRDGAGEFDIKHFEHAVRLWTVTLEISVLMAQFLSKEIAQGSYDYRTLGLAMPILAAC